MQTSKKVQREYFLNNLTKMSVNAQYLYMYFFTTQSFILPDLFLNVFNPSLYFSLPQSNRLTKKDFIDALEELKQLQLIVIIKSSDNLLLFFPKTPHSSQIMQLNNLEYPAVQFIEANKLTENEYGYIYAYYHENDYELAKTKQEESWPVKIGKTQQEINHRIKQGATNISSQTILGFIGIVPKIQLSYFETKMHKLLNEYKIDKYGMGTEWFSTTPKNVSEIFSTLASNTSKLEYNWEAIKAFIFSLH